ncbi:hypothetical protein B566_EDAN019235, partial [Ephemera danica]
MAPPSTIPPPHPLYARFTFEATRKTHSSVVRRGRTSSPWFQTFHGHQKEAGRKSQAFNTSAVLSLDPASIWR